MPIVEVSEALFSRVQSKAVPLVDSFEDVVLRALDALEATKPSEAINVKPGPSGRDLISYVGRVPHGTRIKMDYKGRAYMGEVRDGRVVWNGRSFNSLSDAAVAVIQSTGSPRPTENGWRVWHAQDVRGRWTPLTELRRGW